MRKFSNLIVVLFFTACFACDEGKAQPGIIEPIPTGTIDQADRDLLNNFLSRFRSYGTYHAFGRTTLHVHGNNPVHRDAKAELIYSRGADEFLIRSNRLYRIWGDYYEVEEEVLDDGEEIRGINYTVVDMDKRKESNPCGSPLDIRGGASAKESISMFASMPFLMVADMLQNKHFIDDMLLEVSRLKFNQNADNQDRHYNMVLELRDGGVARFSFDSNAKFLTHMRHDFPAELRPVGTSEMFVECLPENNPEAPHRGQDQFHTNLIRNGKRDALAVVPDDPDGGDPCAGAVSTQAMKVPEESVLENLLSWLFGN